MQRRWFGRWNPLLVSMLAVLVLGMGAWQGIGRAPLVFGAGRLSEDMTEKLATQILKLVGGEAKGYAKVTIAETGPAEWPQLYYVRFWCPSPVASRAAVCGAGHTSPGATT